MTQDGHPGHCGPGADGCAVFVCTFAMAAGDAFRWHTHDEHQLAWAPHGVLTVVTEQSTWVLPPTRALWIPAGLRHETRAAGPATMRSAYLQPDRCPADWPAPVPVSASPLLAELVTYLERADLAAAARSRAEAMLTDLLEPLEHTTIEVRMPADDRARDVAAALAADPADKRTLTQWGQAVGASERTLARAFLDGTGISFGRWRTRLRLQAALPALASGLPVSSVARRAGYRSTSAFVAAFRRETGLTPAAYFAVPES